MRTRQMSRTATRAGGRRAVRLLVSCLAALATALTVGTVAGSAGSAAEATAAVQLSSISARADGGLLSVLIEASAPAAYVATRPDPFTVLVDLRHATAKGVANRVTPVPGGVLQDVAVEETTAEDGAALARVRLRLTRPVPHVVKAERNLIRVDLQASESAGVLSSAPVQVPAIAPAPAVGQATQITSVKAATDADAIRITLGGNGKLSATTVEMLRNAPTRLVLDFVGVASRAPARTAVAQGAVQQVRVAHHSVTPLVTRVVVDLTSAVPYEMAQAATGDLVVTFKDNRPAGLATPADAAKTAIDSKLVAPAPARPTPAAVKPPIPSVPASNPPASKKADAKTVAAGPAAPMPLESRPVDKVKPPDPMPPMPTSPAPARPEPPVRSPQPTAAGQVPQGGVQAPGAAPKQYTGHPVSFDFQGADLRTVLRTFAEISGLNIVIDPKVDGSVDVALHDVPWDQALEMILRSNKLGYMVDGTIVRIAPLTVLADEEKDRRKLADEQALSGELKIMTRALSYAQAAEVVELVKTAGLSNRGEVVVDKRTNTVIVRDLPVYVDKVQALLNTLDQPETQVEIEARIVRTTHNLANQLGTRWGFAGKMVPELGNTTGLAYPNSVTGSGDVDLTHADTPAGILKLATGAINGAFNLNLELDALEKDSKLKILLTPRVVTQNNVTAIITRGEEIPYQTLTQAAGTGAMLIPMVQFKTAALKLQVTPRITPAGTVLMDIDVDNGSAGEPQENGNRAINTQRAQTRVIVRDGATTVIGGIYGTSDLRTTSGVPWLRRVPLLGWLFKNSGIDTQDEELLIFITPRIIKLQ